MKRAPFYLKATAAALLVCMLGAGAALTAVKVIFPEPRMRAWFTDAARKQLGREVHLERIDVGLRGLTLRGLEISENPGFAAGTFLRVDSFRLRPSWKALLKRRFVVATVAADGLKVQVVRGAGGKFNYESMLSSAPAAAATAKAGDAAPAELDVRRASVSGGELEYSDASGAKWTMSGLDMDLRDFSQAAPFGAAASFRVRGAAGTRPVDARVSFDGKIDLARGSREKFKATVKRLIVEQQGVKLDASGSASRLDAPELVFDAKVSADGRELLQAAGTAKSGEATSADLKWKTPGLDTTMIAKFAPGVPALNLPAAEGVLAGTFSADAAELSSFRAAWSGGKIEGAGTARGLESAKPVYEGRAAFGLDAPEIRPGQYPFLKLPPKLTLPAARLDGEIALKGDDLKITALTAKAKQGTVTANGTVRGAASAKPVPDLSVTVALDLPAFKVSELPFPVSGVPGAFAVPAGRLEGGARVSGDEVRLSKMSFKAKGASLVVDGLVAPAPDATIAADLALPALTDKDLPFPGVPAGLQLPPSHWTTETAYASHLIRVKSLRAVIGRNDVEASGTVTDPSGRGAYDLLIKCRSFVLEEITQATPATRDAKLSGSGFFALSMTGTKEKPIYAGKLQFKSLGATVAQLPMTDFTGTVSFDANRVDVPNLTGKLGDGTLKMDLTVKNYAAAPDVELDAVLDRFDLGRYLAAKNKVVAERAAAKAAKPGAKPDEKPRPISTRGHFDIGALMHPKATVNDVRLSWNLRGVAADLHGLNGDAKLHVGGGRVLSLADIGAEMPMLKPILLPMAVIQSLGGIGGLRSNYGDKTLNQIAGDYGFENGIMTLRQSEMDSDATQVSATGTIDLPGELLNLLVIAKVGLLAPAEIAVTGPFDNPKKKVNIAKFLATPAKQAGEFLKNILGQ